MTQPAAPAQPRRERTSTVPTEHLTGGPEKDWGDFDEPGATPANAPAPAAVNTAATTTPPPATNPAPAVVQPTQPVAAQPAVVQQPDGQPSFFQQLQMLMQQKTAEENRIKEKITRGEAFLADLRAQLAALQQMNFGGVAAPVAATSDAQPAPRGGRRRRSSTAAPAAEGSAAPAARTGRGRRPKNDMTLKEAILHFGRIIQATGVRPELNSVSKAIIDSGFKTNSKKFSNTVRVQLYRLEEDKKIVFYDDNSFSIK